MEPLTKLYKISISGKKAAFPLLIPVVVELLIGIAKAKGIEIDKSIAYTIASAGYGAVLGLVNYIKNRKK
jgi:uncharacterized protein (DUF697 family)